ncbi:hypothetical protein LCGC14_0386570 [marine sediment metagenome]|uniref:Uncharacterized protein n=1 Tax=marine sediment metagenome TaxID=412755 RepID=A0A0F9W9Y1_9ZZZZ
MNDTYEIRQYWRACDELFKSGIDTSNDLRHIREQDYHQAWRRLLQAGYTPEDALRLGRP